MSATYFDVSDWGTCLYSCASRMFTQVVIAPFFIGPKAYEAFELFLGKGQCLVVSIRYYWVISLWAFILAVMETTIKNCLFDVVIKPREIIDLRMLIQPGKDDKEIILCTECCLHLSVISLYC